MSEPRYDYSGKVVAITGAGAGIGKAAAVAFAAAGAAVFVLDNDVPAGEATAAAASGGATFVACDVTDENSVAAAFARVGEEHGRLDVLINNAGGFWEQLTVEETSLDDWRAVLDLNLTGVFLCARAAIPLLRESSAGRLINLGSLAGQTTMYRSSPPYAAAKAGVHSLSRVLAYELAADGITCNALSPSMVATERITVVRSEEERAESAASVPMRRYGLPEEVVAVLLFLASEASGYITGQTIPVNGGRWMG